MQQRLSILNDHGLTMSMIQDVISTLSPSMGRKSFSRVAVGSSSVDLVGHIRTVRPTIDETARVANDLVPSAHYKCRQDLDYRLRIDDKNVELSRRCGSNSPSLRR